MRRRKFGREFKVEAVKLVKDRGVSVAQARLLGLRTAFSGPDHTRFGPKQGRQAAVQRGDPSNAHQENYAHDADQHLRNDAARNLHQDPVSGE